MVSLFERNPKWTLRATSLFLLVASLALVAPQPAQAGRYHVYSCRTPSGAAAPVDGWSGSVGAESAIDVHTLNTCSSGGALIGELGDVTTHFANTDSATWTLAIPGPEQLAGATLWRASYLHGGKSENATYESWLAAPAPTEVFEECLYGNGCHGEGTTESPLSTSNRVDVPSKHLGAHLYVNVACGPGLPGSQCGHGFGDANGYAAAVYLYAADLTLGQSAGPTVGNIGGDLASAPTVGGMSDVTFNASDPGAGIYQAILSVDGQVVQRSTVDEQGGRCRSAGQAADGSAAFLYLQPCPQSVGGDISFDTTRLPNGPHHLVVSVIDAAGNAAVALDRSLTIFNPGAPGPLNGTNASTEALLTVRWAKTSNTRLVSAYGHSQTIVGRLTGPGGVPISGAQLGLLATPSAAGAGSVAMSSPRTGPDGRFEVRLPAGASSRSLTFSYRTRLGDPLPVAQRTLTLSVRAAVALTIAPRTARVGRRIRFHGRLLGSPVPRAGKQLVLEARSPRGKWLQFKVVRTDSRGRYHASYRFRFPGPAVYQFRVRSEPESDYPFVAGSSRTITVRER
jgi:hypothetical protein